MTFRRRPRRALILYLLWHKGYMHTTSKEMGGTQSKDIQAKEESPLEKPMTHDELLMAVEKDTDSVFRCIYDPKSFGVYSQPLTRYILAAYATGLSLETLYKTLDKYNTPYFIEMPQAGRYRVRFIRVPVEKP